MLKAVFFVPGKVKGEMKIKQEKTRIKKKLCKTLITKGGETERGSTDKKGENDDEKNN